MGRDKFNDVIDKELLSNGFAYFDDWEYGPTWKVAIVRKKAELPNHGCLEEIDGVPCESCQREHLCQGWDSAIEKVKETGFVQEVKEEE